MLQPFDRLFPEGTGDDDERTIEEQMSEFKVIFKSNVKVYQGKATLETEAKTLAVWTFGSCVAKLREGRKTDIWLSAAAEKAAEFDEKHKNGDKMTQLWAADCMKIWQKAFDYVMNEPAPEAPPEPADFGEPEDPGDQSPPAVQEPQKKTSIFKRNK
jgi:hypothetical protein